MTLTFFNLLKLTTCLLWSLCFVLQAATAAPVANIKLAVSSGEIPFTLRANAGASFSPTGHALTKFSWTTSDNRQKEGSQVSFTFDRAGNYQLILAVTDDQGLVGRAIQLITALPVANLDLSTNTSPIAKFELSTERGVMPLNVHLEGGVVKIVMVRSFVMNGLARMDKRRWVNRQIYNLIKLVHIILPCA